MEQVIVSVICIVCIIGVWWLCGDDDTKPSPAVVYDDMEGVSLNGKVHGMPEDLLQPTHGRSGGERDERWDQQPPETAN